MGLFDFLKVAVKDKKPAKPARMAVSVIEFDGRSFPIAALTTKGFATKAFDGSLIQGQNARVTVRVDDPAGKFSFAATIAVTDTQGGKLVGVWTMLPTEVEDVIRKYAQIRSKQQGGK
ncbi:hypothetical protein D3877_06580 [Azospirillum cavernae]|uniref:PilZ domain-containing protein n=1 Tax=Azospirillum cavernae TaxID=2320860 RepID=A0A418W2L3_9PROT|nr:hypothetical protein [Azospirillum cavernae]RJF84236.1 hypothetical protein D3877_06580 [Azospirillum cavernae]